MRNYDSVQHVRGESIFVDDIAAPNGTLFAGVVYSNIAHGKLLSFDASKALALEGVAAVLTAKDIPGENQIGGIVQDEPLLAETELHFIGMPIAIVVAADRMLVRKALKLISYTTEEQTPVLDPREAFAKGQLIIPPREFKMGDTEKAFKECDIIIEGQVESGGQEHLYLETQGALAQPLEGNSIRIISSTQSPTAVQKTAAKVLGLPMNQVEVDVVRLGGGFGGKEDQASAWGAIAALAAYKLRQPVKLILPRGDDMRMTGKRHPYASDYKIGLRRDGTILAYEVQYYQNAGAAADLSPAILERTLFHCTNSYFIPNVQATAYSCKTNLPPNTAFRGFGGPQGMFVIEAAIYKAADALGMDPIEIQRKNLLKTGDEFPYGQKASNFYLRDAFAEMETGFNLPELKGKVTAFNRENKSLKKGIAVMPITFGISFTSTFLNQASALVHIYSDGSVAISTAAIEMGQGVNAKIIQTALKTFSINPDRIKVLSTNTNRNANTSATAASSGADMNGFATQKACVAIWERLAASVAGDLGKTDPAKVSLRDEVFYYDGQKTDLLWAKAVFSAYFKRVGLSAHAHHATENIWFDRATMKGDAFAYHVTGAAIIEVTLDCLRGTYVIDSAKIVHDNGISLQTLVDRGQIEGALTQGIGWMTQEEVAFNEKGRLLTDTLSTYKVPDIFSAPQDIQIRFHENAGNPVGVHGSKAIGEPPLMYGIGAYFALMNAIKAFRPGKALPMIAPMTPERALNYLYQE
jgi:xanthine dehydrogenase large subunit